MVRRYMPDDYSALCKWYQKRGIPCPNEAFVPDIGYIVPGVGAGFMIQTDIPYAILDLFITNPQADKSKRTEALDQIVVALLAKAKYLDCRLVRAETRLNTIRELAQRHGFQSTGDYALLSKEL